MLKYGNDINFILYLDMDGVVTSSNYIVKIHDAFVGNSNDEDKDFYYRNFMHQWCFQKEAVECLNKLYDLVPYAIIITSTRRFELVPVEWNTVFQINGIKAYVGGRTNKLSKYKDDKYAWREDEIEDYHFRGGTSVLKDFPLIIIDDDDFDLQIYKDKLIHVNTETGLTMDYYNEILDKLEMQGINIKGDK